jgi:hypothetical protein
MGSGRYDRVMERNRDSASKSLMWTAPEVARAWFRISRLWITEARGNRRRARAGFRFERLPVREAASLPASNAPGLQWPKAQQRKPMRMALAGHQFPRAFAVAVGKSAAHEASMVQEELKQAQV